METAKIAAVTILGIVVLAVCGFALRYADLNSNRFFAPREEQVRHNTFECSQSHSDGMAREIRQYQDQYGTADAAGKTIIRQRVLQDAESQNSDACPLPSDVQSFVQSIR